MLPSSRVSPTAANSAQTPGELFNQLSGREGGYAETKLRCRMENNAEDENVVVRNGTASSSSLTAAQTVTASMAALARTVEQTEAQLRTQVRVATKYQQTFFVFYGFIELVNFIFKGSSDFCEFCRGCLYFNRLFMNLSYLSDVFWHE